MSARDAIAEALMRHQEGHDTTRDMIEIAEWSDYLEDADYVASLLRNAGYAVVPREATEAIQAVGAEHMHGGDKSYREYSAARVYRAMITAAEGEK